MSIPFIISLNLAKIIALFGGTALPGYLALKIYPNLINQIRLKYRLKSIIITGTNGKTTTSKLIGSMFNLAGIGHSHNQSGSNLIQGIATALIKQRGGWGVFEVDEATVPQAIKMLKPVMVVILNLSRDQLDRYGELDTLIDKWQKSFSFLPKNARILLNGADHRLLKLCDQRIEYFGLGKKDGLSYPDEYQGKFTNDSLRAAAAVGKILNLNPGLVKQAALATAPAFGRGETFSLNQESYQISLVKNPASFKAVWRMFLDRGHLHQPLLMLLNDNLADGTDVSWIYDVPFTGLAGRTLPVVVSGIRSFDLALRLKYAGLNPNLILVETNMKKALKRLMTIAGSPKYIFPTYTAMLKLRKYLNRKAWN